MRTLPKKPLCRTTTSSALLTGISIFVEDFILVACKRELSAHFRFGVDYSPRRFFLFIRENLSREINSSQNSIQSRQYCAPLGCGDAAAANAVRLKG
jgi:hypothetical protein